MTFIYQNEALDECYPAVCLTQKTPTYDVSPIQARNELMQFNWRLYYGQRLLLHIWHQNNYFLLKTLPWKKMKNYSDFLKHTTDWKPFSCSYIKLLFLTVSPALYRSDNESHEMAQMHLMVNMRRRRMVHTLWSIFYNELARWVWRTVRRRLPRDHDVVFSDVDVIDFRFVNICKHNQDTAIHV